MRLAGVRETQTLALSFFEAEVEPRDFHVQRHAELLLDMGRADKAEALLKPGDLGPGPAKAREPDAGKADFPAGRPFLPRGQALR